jgi:hypothetical protein
LSRRQKPFLESPRPREKSQTISRVPSRSVNPTNLATLLLRRAREARTAAESAAGTLFSHRKRDLNLFKNLRRREQAGRAARRTRGSQCQPRIFVDRAYLGYLSFLVTAIILNDAKRIDPQPSNTNTARNFYSFRCGLWEILDWNAFLVLF